MITNRDTGDETSYVECSSCLEEALPPYYMMDGNILCQHCYKPCGETVYGYASDSDVYPACVLPKGHTGKHSSWYQGRPDE